MRSLWIVQECIDRRWRRAITSDMRIGEFLFPNDTEEDGLTELALWQAESGRYRLIEYVPKVKP